MELKTYSDFKRQLAEISARAAITITPFSSSPQTKTSNHTYNSNYCSVNGNGNGNSNSNSNSNSRSNNSSCNKRSFLFEEGNGAGFNTRHIIGNSLSSSNHSSRKRMKSSDRLSPLSLPRNHGDNNINANSCNNSVISSSNSSINTNTSTNGDASNQAINNSAPFPASTWWKKGNEDIRDLMSTSITSTGALAQNANNSCDNSCASNSGNGMHSNDKSISNGNSARNPTTESMAPSPFPSAIASNSIESRLTGNSISMAASPSVLSSAISGDQKPSSWLQLLGEVASSGGNHHRAMLHPQHQLLQHQELQGLRMQENDRVATSGNSNPFLAGSSPDRYSNSLNNNLMMGLQSRLQPVHVLDLSVFSSDGMNMSHLQLQQQQHYQQQQQQQFQLQQQSLYPLAFSHSNAPLYSTQNSIFQQRQNQAQRQQMQRPEAARAEVKIDAMRTSGDIGEAPLPAMERELEESYQQDASFDEEGGNGGNENGMQKTNNQSSRRKDNIEMIDVNDLVFSDIVPMIPTSASRSLKVEGFDANCVNVDDVDVDIDVHTMAVGNNDTGDKLVHQHSSHSPSSSKNQAKLSTFPIQNSRAKEVKFRAYQAENWTEKFEELLRFREENGHCLVPNCHPENPALAQWTKRQRYQYKLKQDGKRSTITDERVRALDEAGFVWDSHKAVWSERLEELKEFKKQYKHCNVPSRYKSNHQLAIWVKRQRRQWKNKLDSLPNCMTDDRQRALEIIGFVWDMKKGKRPPVSSPSKNGL